MNVFVFFGGVMAIFIAGFLIIAWASDVKRRGPTFIPIGFVPWAMMGPIVGIEIMVAIDMLWQK